MTILKRLRLSKRWGLRTLANKAGVGEATIYSIEAGEKSPTLRTLRKLASALDVTVSQLIGEIPIKESDSHGKTVKSVHKL